jgi:hypothetical protein
MGVVPERPLINILVEASSVCHDLDFSRPGILSILNKFLQQKRAM